MGGTDAMPTRILAFAGSSRRESLNRGFLAFGVESARELGCEVTLLDLNEYVLPLYNGDLEDRDGLPENAAKLIGLIAGHDGLLIASPEYNSMITPLLKNTLDWVSRVHEPGEQPRAAFRDRVFALGAASNGNGRETVRLGDGHGSQRQHVGVLGGHPGVQPGANAQQH